MAIKYVEKLTSTLVTESGNPLFYEGKVVEGAKSLTKQEIIRLKNKGWNTLSL